jgi:ABC-2 type transport system ATP-binding protein
MDAIVLESVSKTFRHRPALFNWLGQERGGNTQALDRVTFNVAKGTTLVLLGPNGSGKTTTLKLISTMLLPDSGSVRVAGFDTLRDGKHVRRQVGFAVANERSFFPRLTCRENLDFFAALNEVSGPERRDCIDNMLEQTGLTDAANTLVMKFSSGMYQRLGIARALMGRPSVILLDEPTRSLDPASAVHFWRLVRYLGARGATVVLATHSFNEAVAVGDSVAVLHDGVLVGRRNLDGADVDELRDFYFDRTGIQDACLTMAVAL